jgi:hypothetical protein
MTFFQRQAGSISPLLEAVFSANLAIRQTLPADITPINSSGDSLRVNPKLEREDYRLLAASRAMLESECCPDGVVVCNSIGEALKQGNRLALVRGQVLRDAARVEEWCESAVEYPNGQSSPSRPYERVGLFVSGTWKFTPREAGREIVSDLGKKWAALPTSLVEYLQENTWAEQTVSSVGRNRRFGYAHFSFGVFPPERSTAWHFDAYGPAEEAKDGRRIHQTCSGDLGVVICWDQGWVDTHVRPLHAQIQELVTSRDWITDRDQPCVRQLEIAVASVRPPFEKTFMVPPEWISIIPSGLAGYFHRSAFYSRVRAATQLHLEEAPQY